MRKVIANSTPLISLGKINQFYLLKALYHEICIPGEVFREISAKDDAIKSLVVNNGDWIKVRNVANPGDRKMYSAALHGGEVEVLILAQEIGADLVIFDDLKARKTALYLGIPLTGTIGVLIKAKKQGLIPCVMPLVDKLEKNNIYVDSWLRDVVRKNTGE